MASSVTIGKAQLVFILCLPLAVLLGYLLSDPLDPGNTLLVVLMVGALSIPVLMRGHHALLVFAWNAAITPAFLPGQPFLWLPLAFLGLGFAVVNRFVTPEGRFVSVPAITRPLLFLLVVVLATALAHGGFGIRTLGSETYGGRNYVYILGAIVGYFALSSQRIPPQKANFYIALFFLTGLTALISNLIFLGGPAWYVLYYVFPPVYALEQATGRAALDAPFVRVVGLTAASLGLLSWVLARYGLRRIFYLRRPWPFFLFILAFLGCAFTGFRTVFVTFILMFICQFLFERLFRWGTVFPSLGLLLLAAAVVLPNADRLPIVVQRTISVLPAKITPIAELSAEGSSTWRLEMWKDLLPEVPQYLLKGKGFGIDPTDLAFAQRDTAFASNYSAALAAGDYHSGPLSLIIPLGIWGVIAFAWFIIAGLRYLYRQYRYGDPALQTINTFFLAYFIARLIVYLVVFGGFFSDLFIFTGIIGMSVSLNGSTMPQRIEAEVEAEPAELTYQERLASQRAP